MNNKLRVSRQLYIYVYIKHLICEKKVQKKETKKVEETGKNMKKSSGHLTLTHTHTHRMFVYKCV